MFMVPATREVPAIGVLLGGTGLARRLAQPPRPLAALFKPLPISSQTLPGRAEPRALEVSPC